MRANVARSMPLLARELVELAARKRTYVMRVLYASGLFLIAGLVLQDTLNRTGGTYLQLLGQGKTIFEAVISVQVAGLYLFLPAMMCGAIAQEKERDSLELLLLTDLSPAAVVLQKFFGRLVPMLTFLLLSLPMMAVAFTLGGVEMAMVYLWVWSLLLIMLQVGAVSLAASAFCRSTASAFLMSYIALAVLYALPFIALALYSIVYSLLERQNPIGRRVEALIALLYPFMVPMSMPLLQQWFEGALFSLGQVHEGLWRLLLTRLTGVDTAAQRGPLGWAFAAAISSGATLLTTIVALVLARRWLVTRAHVPAGSFVMSLFRGIDKTMNQSNRLVGGIVLIPDRETLPGDRPVAWLETAKRPTGKARYLIRLLVLTMIPVLFVSSAVVIHRGGGSQSEALSVVLMLIWAVAVLLLLVQGASAVSSERRRQTLGVLLATPLQGSDILRQKMAPAWRLIAVLLVPFLTLIITEAWWEYGLEQYSSRSWVYVTPTWLYLVCSALSLLIYLPMVAYLGLLLGLMIRSQVRAIMASLAVMAGWLALPVLVYMVFMVFFDHDWQWLFYATPATIVVVNEGALWGDFTGTSEFNNVGEFGQGMWVWWVAALANFALYGIITLALRASCLRNADRLLGRN